MSDFLEWVTHGVKRRQLGMDSHAAVALSIVAGVLAMVTALYLILVGRIAARGRSIEGLKAEIFRLERENQHITVEIAAESAVFRLEERAEALGFVPAEEIEYVVSSD